MNVTWHPSPNFGPRRGGAVPDLIVLHYTAMPSAQAALARLCDPEIEVSAHYLIGRDGAIFQLVDEAQRAWHAGAGSWGAVTDVNSRSIGIELDNSGSQPFPEPQVAALETVLAEIMARWQIPPERIIGHSDMAPGRKSDPGARFDWRRLARRGLAVWSEWTAPEPGDAEAFCRAAVQFGYPPMPLQTLLTVFRLRFRPWAAGPLTAADVAEITDLAARFPVDGGAASA